ncbi:hypothetical protein A8C32_13275 [Flavivirga aquatica]|uniref:cellulase n=1 Tax=Flavivirga aquatica TaxID=1849968 RepID=A0A1E5TE98_9FLAO|nr:glycosyl hydrolase family 8 [Flavivirga aquatica]OEK09667.1 hypothetical protein A8C32_13275 [Flavivirga aquatica]
MKKINLAVILVLLCINFNDAQSLLNLNYKHGTLPTNLKPTDVTSAYTTWKTKFTESCGDDRIRVKFDNPAQTVSEGIGYGMLIAAYAGDQTLLDGLWKYYINFLNGNGVMNWKINGCSSVDGQNGATDAELDAAIALMVAERRWGNTGTINYGTAATNLIDIIKTHEVESGTNVLKPGDAWGGSQTTNISYYSPGYYRAYGSYTNDSNWAAIASKSYEIINLNQSVNNAVHNLVSDWCNANGGFSSEVGWAKNQGKTYSYDAARTPWRIAVDYLWYGNNAALTYSNKSIDFINDKGGLDNIYAGYNLDGTQLGDVNYKDITFTGAYAVAAMASTDQNFVNSAYSQVVNMTTNAYFGSTLRVLYLLAMSGNFYNPEDLSVLGTSNFNVNQQNNPFYPNPARREIKMTFETPQDNQVKIYNINGKLVSKYEYNIKSSTLDIENLSRGLYFISINNIKYKLIKQ